MATWNSMLVSDGKPEGQSRWAMIQRRTFDALREQPGSEQRRRYNSHPATSEYRRSHLWSVEYRDEHNPAFCSRSTYRTKQEAITAADHWTTQG